jgi:hypothetical protein
LEIGEGRTGTQRAAAAVCADAKAGTIADHETVA